MGRNTPTAAVAQLQFKGQVVASALVGQRDPMAGSDPPGDTTAFRLGSVTKVFTVIMLYQLLERGVVQSLDDPVSKYEPRFRAINSYSDSKWQFTLRQLSSQLSGLPLESPCPMFDCHVSTDEVLRRWSSTPGAIWPENTQASYSNFAFSLLGHVLAGLAGLPYADYVRRHILEPLGMTGTGFVLPDAAAASAAVAYGNGTRVPWYDMGWNAPSDQAYSTLRDMGRLCQFLLGMTGHGVLDGGLRRELLLPSFFFRDGAFLTGSPWEIVFHKESHSMVIGKGGFLPGYSAYMSLIPPLNLSLVVLWSGMVYTEYESERFLNQLLPTFTAALGPRYPRARLPDSPASYIGTYTGDLPASGEHKIRIARRARPDGGWGLAFFLWNEPEEESMWLDFRSNTEATMAAASAEKGITCGTKMGTGMDMEWVLFRLDGHGFPISMELPGILYGTTFRRTQADGRERRPALRR